MGKYAKETKVSTEKSRMEIEKTLQRYGANGFMYGQQGDRAVIAFEMKERRVKFLLPLPDPTSKEFTHTSYYSNKRKPEEVRAAWDKACRQRWRALALAIKAKLEAVESEITTFESEFMAHIMLPDGQTVGGWIEPQLKNAYGTGKMPPLLGYGS